MSNHKGFFHSYSTFFYLGFTLLFVYASITSFLYRRSYHLYFVVSHLIIIDFINISNFHGGPGVLMRGLADSFKTYQGKCVFRNESISFSEMERNYQRDKFYYIPSGNGFCENAPAIYSKRPEVLNNLILGPLPVPYHWRKFPDRKVCAEKNFSRSLDMMGLYVVHSERVRDYLAKKSHTTNRLNKYCIMRSCTNLKPADVKPFTKRKYDIIFYEKYADFNREKDGLRLYNLLVKANFSIIRLSYQGFVKNTTGYNHTSLFDIAGNSKYIVYYSFWDTGAIALKEIQNFGVYSFSVQRDLINNQTGIFVPELDKKIEMASKIIINKIKNSIEKIDAKKMAEINQYENSCDMSLKELCNGVINNLVHE